ncbi:hypothetical protein QYF36_002819 [Acer negundo]|nr:hypothetical protein QYF36_002819 [Acer negundo]
MKAVIWDVFTAGSETSQQLLIGQCIRKIILEYASMNLRKAILGFIVQLDVNELPLFFALLIKP